MTLLLTPTQTMVSELVQKRLPKYRRTDESNQALARRQITDRSLDIISNIYFYRFLPTSLIVRLVSGNQDITYRHLQTLYHRGLINRFAFPRVGNPGEFVYYLDNPQALKTLVEHGWTEPGELEFSEVERNREKRYCDILDSKYSDEMQGKLQFLKHELMVTRFHSMLELACKQSQGKVSLVDWRQGPSLWNSVLVPSFVVTDRQFIGGEEKIGWLEDQSKPQKLPHRPDAMFSLAIADLPEPIHFFYEADRKTTSTHRHNKKLRAHFHYIVKQRRHEEHYGVKRIRAVLIETTKGEWAENLRYAARHPMVSGPKPSPIFWFTTSELFTQSVEVKEGSHTRTIQRYLAQPDIVLKRIWATPVEDKLISFFD